MRGEKPEKDNTILKTDTGDEKLVKWRTIFKELGKKTLQL